MNSCNYYNYLYWHSVINYNVTYSIWKRRTAVSSTRMPLLRICMQIN